MRWLDGFVLFMADRPHVGLDPHPAFAPNHPVASTAQGWASAYLMFDTRAEAENEAARDHEVRMDYVEHPDDCVGAPHFPLAVRIFENGNMEVFADAARTDRLACYTKADLFGAIGMEAPTPKAA